MWQSMFIFLSLLKQVLIYFSSSPIMQKLYGAAGGAPGGFPPGGFPGGSGAPGGFPAGGEDGPSVEEVD